MELKKNSITVIITGLSLDFCIILVNIWKLLNTEAA